jgi:glycerol-3-phosphate acyltransferase PlsY
MARIVCLLIGYCFGLFQTAVLYSKAQGIDIHSVGSGNAGTTNMLRALGIKAGLVTMTGDILKCIVPIIITWLIFRNSCPELFPLLKIWTGAGVVLGHDFPVQLKFKGGKGIACTAGLIIAFGDWHWIVVGIIVFFGLFFTTHYVSLCSICLSLEFGIGATIGAALGWYSKSGMTTASLIEMCVLIWIVVGLNIFQHRANIKRLVGHYERKTYLSHEKNMQVEAERKAKGL